MDAAVEDSSRNPVPPSGRTVMLIGLIAGFAFLLGAFASIAMIYYWPPITVTGPRSQQLPDPSSFPGGTFPDGSQLVWEDGQWVVAIEPKELYATNFPTNFTVSIMQGQKWDFFFDVEDELLLPRVYLRFEILPYGSTTSSAEMTVTVSERNGASLLSAPVQIPPAATEFELSMPASDFPSSFPAAIEVSVHVTSANSAVSIVSVRIINEK